jgi:hypothetical protein
MLFLLVNSNVKSEDLNKYGKKNNPKLSAYTGDVYYLTFHPCYMNAADTNNSVSIYVLPQASGKAELSIYGLNISRTLNLIADSLAEFKLTPIEAFTYLREPKDSVLLENIFEGRAIKILADVPVSVYGMVKFNGRTEGFNALPESELGKTYQVANYNSTDQPSYTSIIGYYDNTKVTFRLGGCEASIIVRENGDTIRLGGVIRRTVNEGDVWVIPGFGPCNDLSGSVVTSTKPCAVITGSYSAGIPTNNSSTQNYLIEQELPTNIWGTKYYISPVVTRKNFPIIKIFAKKPYTQVYADGIPMWAITTPGGRYGAGYIEARAGAEPNPRPVVISSDEGFPINVVQFNPGNEDETLFKIPFKMQVASIEQFTKEVMFSTPSIPGDKEFTDNYINIVYKATPDGAIPDDMQFAELKDGQFNWIPMNAYSNIHGTRFAYDAPDENGRNYFSKTLRLNTNNVYRIKANDPFAVYMYGFGKNGTYGFPVTENYKDLETTDILAPFIEVNQCCCGRGVWGKVIDEPRIDPENRSNLGLIYMDSPNSYNYSFDVQPYEVGTDATTTWSLFVMDETVNAQAHLVFQDRAGNRSDTVINYVTVIPKILETKADFGTYHSINPPITKTMTFTLKNFSGHDLESDRFGIYLTLYSKTNTKTYQNFDLVDIEGIDLSPIKTDAEIKFNVKFTGDKYGSFRDSIGIVIRDRVGEVDTCSISYFTEISALMAEAYIIADDYDFGKQEIYKRSNPVTLKITNPNTSDFNSVLPLRITGYNVSGDYTANYGSSAIFEIEGLQNISEANPLIIDPGKDYSFKVTFKPDSERLHESKISFIAKTDNSIDFVNMPDNETILKGWGEPPASVNDSESENVIITPNPASDYIEISSLIPTLKRGVEECSEIQIFDMLGVNLSPAGGGIKGGGRIDISNLAPGIYFIKIGNRVEKFVKM